MTSRHVLFCLLKCALFPRPARWYTEQACRRSGGGKCPVQKCECSCLHLNTLVYFINIAKSPQLESSSNCCVSTSVGMLMLKLMVHHLREGNLVKLFRNPANCFQNPFHPPREGGVMWVSVANKNRSVVLRASCHVNMCDHCRDFRYVFTYCICSVCYQSG